MAVLTVYPDEHVETTSVDGTVEEWYTSAVDGKDWATIHDAGGNRAFTDGTFYTNRLLVGFQTTEISYPNKWHGLLRNILVFDISDIPTTSIAISVVLSLYGEDKIKAPTASPTVNIYSASPASNTDLVAGDYDSLGTTPYCDTAISYANWSTTGHNSFIMNATGLSAVNTAISADGIIKIGFREASYDVADIEPTWSASDSTWFWYYSAEKGGDFRPRLVINYADSTTDRVTGLTIRHGPGYFDDELHLGGLSTSWRLVDLQKGSTPAVPAVPTEAPQAVTGPYWHQPDINLIPPAERFDPESLEGFWFMIVNGRWVRYEDYLAGNY